MHKKCAVEALECKGSVPCFSSLQVLNGYCHCAIINLFSNNKERECFLKLKPNLMAVMHCNFISERKKIFFEKKIVIAYFSQILPDF